ncbi:MAG: DNA polymerase III subunit gamma/tau [Patescibacteria group bacterium]
MSTLYRDYRPQNFSEVFGQNHIKITLQNEISAGQMAQAYLFCGPRAVGKTTLARVLAKALNCTKRKDKESEPCNKCANCLSITQGSNLDVIEIDAASNTGVDNVRENIIAFSRVAPNNTKFKVFIIDEVHMLSISAFNALLKIIEEPPTYVVFILCTTEIQKVPTTIISRCQRFDFKRISISDVVKKLNLIAAAEKITVDQEVLESVARRSGGHLRDAESLLGQIFSLGDKTISLEQAELVMPHYNSSEAIDLIESLGRKDAAKAIILINNLVDSGANLKNFNAEIINLLRKIMLNKLNPSLAANLGLDLGESLELKLNAVETSLEWPQLILFTKKFLESYSDSRNSLITQLPLELVIMELCLLNQNNNLINQPDLKSRVESAPSLKNSFKAKSIAPAKNIENNPPPLNKSDINLDHIAVMEKWPEFLVKIKKYNHSLSFVLQNCQPKEISNGNITLVFKYKFHQDRINDQNIRNIVESTLAEVYCSAVSFDSLIDDSLELKKDDDMKESLTSSSISPLSIKDQSEKTEEPLPNSGSSLMGDLLKTFGGQVIN